MTLKHAVEVFAKGFAFTRSFTHPYLPVRRGPLWRLTDGQRPQSDSRRNEEWLACGVSPAVVRARVRREAQGRHSISVILPAGAPDEGVREAYRAMQYRLITTEDLMVHDLKALPGVPRGVPAVVERVRSAGMADRLTRAARTRQILPEHLATDRPLRAYVALRGGAAVGWVRSITVGRATWCSNMHVVARWRRKGIATALVRRMLADDQRDGSRTAVLSASHAGTRLYLACGYRILGRLLMFLPRRELKGAQPGV